jgi:hypothetical protein
VSRPGGPGARRRETFVEPGGKSEPEKDSRKATRSAVSWSSCTWNTCEFTNRAIESIAPSCWRPKPERFTSCVASKPTFSYRFRSCGILSVTFDEPSLGMSATWFSPFGPGGSGTKVPPCAVWSVPAPVGAVWQVTHAMFPSRWVGGRKRARPCCASPFASGNPAGRNRPVV